MNISAQMRDNPLSVLLIGAGVGLMMTRSFGNGETSAMRPYRGEDAGDMIGRASEAVSNQAQNIRDTMTESYSAATESLSEMGERAVEYTQRATSGLSALATEQPLVLGALGLLAGAALAAMLPRTQLEDEYVRPAARQLRDQASSVASQTLERAKGVASKAADVITSEFVGDEHRGSGAASGGPTGSGTSKPQVGSARPTENISAGQGSGGSQG